MISRAVPPGIFEQPEKTTFSTTCNCVALLMGSESLQERMKHFPKVDLHRHLEGSISPETLLFIAKRYGGDLPSYDLEKLKPLILAAYDSPGFYNFLDKFKVFRGFYPNRAAIEHVAVTAVREAAEDGVKYLELRYSPSHYAGNGKFEEPDVVSWIQSALDRASKEFDIIVTPILTISRDYGLELASRTVDMAVDLPEGYFYGLDIAGNEIENTARPFAGLFHKAKAAGLGLSLHAGEARGAYTVREAVCEYGADRIGHGIRASEDRSVMDILREKDILLEICLTSNLHTGVVPSLQDHPITVLRAHGVPVCLNTDDPAISAIVLSDEYVLAADILGFSEEDLRQLNLAALDHSFYPDRGKLKKKIGHYWSS